MQPNEIDWHAEALFWQQKYTEQLMHSTQIIAALSRPMLIEQAMRQRGPQPEPPAETNGAEVQEAAQQ